MVPDISRWKPEESQKYNFVGTIADVDLLSSGGAASGGVLRDGVNFWYGGISDEAGCEQLELPILQCQVNALEGKRPQGS